MQRRGAILPRLVGAEVGAQAALMGGAGCQIWCEALCATRLCSDKKITLAGHASLVVLIFIINWLKEKHHDQR